MSGEGIPMEVRRFPGVVGTRVVVVMVRVRVISMRTMSRREAFPCGGRVVVRRMRDTTRVRRRTESSLRE